MSKSNELQKPVTVKIQDFRMRLSQVIQEAELPPFLLEMIFRESLVGISNVAQQEYMEDQQKWEQDLQSADTGGDQNNG